MTLTLELPAETETLLQAIAAREGRDVPSLVIEAANEKAERERQRGARAPELEPEAALDALLDELEVPRVGLSDQALTRASFYEA